MPPRPAIPRALALPKTVAASARALTTSTPSSSAASTSASSSSSPFGSLPPLLPASNERIAPTTAREALQHLRATSTPNSGIYCVARLHSRSYLLHPRDILTLPTLKPKQAPGTTLALTRILEVGSREFAIRSPAADGRELRKDLPRGVDVEFESIPPWIASCELTVLEHTKSPLTRTILKKRRKGYKKTIENKQGWTRLRVGDITLGDGVAPVEAEASA